MESVRPSSPTRLSECPPDSQRRSRRSPCYQLPRSPLRSVFSRQTISLGVDRVDTSLVVDAGPSSALLELTVLQFGP